MADLLYQQPTSILDYFSKDALRDEIDDYDRIMETNREIETRRS